MFSLNGRIRATAIAGLIAAGAFAAPAHAHEAGDVLFRVGVTQVRPSQNNGTVLDGSVKLGVSNNVRPSFTLAYMATRNIGIELLGAWPFQHDVSGSNLGKIGSTKQLPPTLSLQWHILPDSMIQPYIGVGINYTHFFDQRRRRAEGLEPETGRFLGRGRTTGRGHQDQRALVHERRHPLHRHQVEGDAGRRTCRHRAHRSVGGHGGRWLPLLIAALTMRAAPRASINPAAAQAGCAAPAMPACRRRRARSAG